MVHYIIILYSDTVHGRAHCVTRLEPPNITMNRGMGYRYTRAPECIIILKMYVLWRIIN